MLFYFTSIVLFIQTVSSDGYPSMEQGVFIDSVYFLPQNLPVDSLKKKSVLGQFQPVPQNYRFSGGSWVCFKLNNPTAAPLSVVLEIESTVFFDLIELFRAEKGTMTSLGITGDFVHHSLRKMKDHALVFPVVLPAVSEGTYFMYVLSPVEFQLPLTIQSLRSFEKKREANNMIYIFYYGFIAFVLVFAIFLAVLLRKERIYLYYSLYLLSLLFLFLHINGFGYEFLWTNWPGFDARIPYLAGVSSMIFLLKFTEQFLRINQLKKHEQNIFKIFLYAFCLSLVLSQVVSFDPLLKKVYIFIFIILLNVIFYVVSWVIAFRVYKTGFKPALFYVIAFLLFFIGVAAYSLRAFTSMNGWLIQHLAQIGNVVEVMTLTLGIAYWFKANNDEKQNLLIQVNRQQKEMAEEKDRIALDLHDSLGGQLSSIAIGLAHLNNANESVQTIRDLADKALAELRDSLWVMSKDSVSMAEIQQRINGLFWQYRKIEVPIDLQIQVDASLLDLQMPSIRSGHLFRIIQEATHNSIKHSKASHFQIHIRNKHPYLEVGIADNGIGFDMANKNGSEHYGLKNMHQRTEKIKGKLTLESAPGHGVKIVLLLPVNG